jgi:hypothetical protein
MKCVTRELDIGQMPRTFSLAQTYIKIKRDPAHMPINYLKCVKSIFQSNFIDWFFDGDGW